MSWIRKSAWLITALVIAVPALVFGIVSWYENAYKSLPVYGEEARDANGRTIEHRIADFATIDQQGRAVHLETVKGKIVVANFFFTSCPNVCPNMMKHVRSVQQSFGQDPRIVFLSFTVDPIRDSAAKLAKYAVSHNINTSNWYLLTGDKREIYKLARKSFYLSATEGDGGENDFIHSDQLVLIDTRHRIRGYYNGTDDRSIENIKTDIKKLEDER